jgi:BlaI family transcriptional regulator, penicillinase repressor
VEARSSDRGTDSRSARASHKIEGRAFVYSGVEKPRNVAVRAVRQILDRFCDGSLEQLLVGLVENEVVDRAELQQLARKLAKKPKGEEWLCWLI